MSLFGDDYPIRKVVRMEVAEKKEEATHTPSVGTAELLLAAIGTQMLKAIEDLATALSDRPVIEQTVYDNKDRPVSASIDLSPVIDAYRGLDMTPVAEAIDRFAAVVESAVSERQKPRGYRMRIERDVRGKASEIFVTETKYDE